MSIRLYIFVGNNDQRLRSDLMSAVMGVPHVFLIPLLRAHLRFDPSTKTWVESTATTERPVVSLGNREKSLGAKLSEWGIEIVLLR